MYKYSVLFLFLLLAIRIEAQRDSLTDTSQSLSWKLKARVIDKESQLPLNGANIINLTQAIGSISNKEGYFLIPVTQRDTLHISFLGYRTEKITITGEMKDKPDLTFYMTQTFSELETVDLRAKLTGILSIDTKNAPIKKDHHRHINGLPQTFETGAPVTREYNTPLDLIFHPIDFIYETFGKKPKELRKLRKLKREEQMRDILEKKMNRDVLMQYLDLDIEQLNSLLAYCHYSDYFIKNASDLQVIEAVLECYDGYKALQSGKLHGKH